MGAALIACRELKATGLEAPRGWLPRLFWSLVGFQLGWTAGYLIHQQVGGRWDWLWVVGSGLALWLGEKLHQIQTVKELDRPTTLFGK